MSSKPDEMKKLDDIPKKVIFTVPDGYFDRLPGVIQSRIPEKKDEKAFQLSWSFTLKYALPVLIFIGIGLVWLQRSNGSLEEKLSLIDTEQLTYYLDDSELTAEELAETMTWSTEDLDALEEDVFSVLSDSGNELNLLLDDYNIDLENF